ncbi:hypothetical protein QSE55_000431 [Escherichia coli]|nr:hypothetical protein [Escherichia coli]
MESNIKGLVSAGHEMASELKAECGAVDMRSVAKLIADADKVLERNTPVADEEWWQDFRAAMLELQERRREELK